MRKRRLLDHIDLRVSDLAKVTSFYERLLPALGFTRLMPIPGWLQYEAVDEDMSAFFRDHGIGGARGE